MLNFIKMDRFTIMIVFTKLLGVLILLLTFGWILSYRGGFGWQTYPNIQFNWHPMLMTSGMVVLYGSAIVVYRVLRNTRKFTTKLIHAGLNLLGFVFTIIGLKAVFDSHNYAVPPIPNMYSLHSWVGILSVIMLATQWLGGFFIFLYPGGSSPMRASYHPLHIYVGIIGLAFATGATLLGFIEKAIYSVKDYSGFQPEGLYINVLGLMVLIYSTSVICLVLEPTYKRLPTTEDQNLLTPKKYDRETTPYYKKK